MKRKNVMVLFGGPSSEHEVSLMSSASVLNQIDKQKYRIIPVGITPEGVFQLYEEMEGIQNGTWCQFPFKRFEFCRERPMLWLVPGKSEMMIQNQENPVKIDVALPILHGPYGEDGVLQGLLEACRIPYVGAGVMTSALAMDKAMTKKIFEREGIPQTPYMVLWINQQGRLAMDVLENLENRLGYPMFVKPARLGSSVGISKARNREELKKAVDAAAHYDAKVIAEAFVDGREIECAVMGHHLDPQVALPSEIIPSREFYDYEDKYLAGESHYSIPAELTEEENQSLKSLAVQVYRLLECTGLARIDFFLNRQNHKWLVNEINTMPGFTKISMYPKMWEATGLSYQDLLDRLIGDVLAAASEPEKKVNR